MGGAKWEQRPAKGKRGASLRSMEKEEKTMRGRRETESCDAGVKGRKRSRQTVIGTFGKVRRPNSRMEKEKTENWTGKNGKRAEWERQQESKKS